MHDLFGYAWLIAAAVCTRCVCAAPHHMTHLWTWTYPSTRCTYPYTHIILPNFINQFYFLFVHIPYRINSICSPIYQQATVQAALGALPLNSIIEVYGPDSPDVVYGDMILTTSIFAILVCAPLGVLLIQFSHKRLLQQVGRERGVMVADDGCD